MGPFDIVEKLVVDATKGARKLVHATIHWGEQEGQPMSVHAGRFSAFTAFTGVEDGSASAEAPTASLLNRLGHESTQRCTLLLLSGFPWCMMGI